MHVTPYLYFNGHCREAFAHYQRVLGGELMLMTYAQMPPDTRDDGCADVSAAAPDQVMHVTLAAGEAPLLMGSDMPPGQHAPGGSNIAVALNFDDNAEAERVFAALAEAARSVCLWRKPSGPSALACALTGSGSSGWSTDATSRVDPSRCARSQELPMHPQRAMDAHIVSLPLAIAFFRAMGLRLLPCNVCEDCLMLRGMCAVATVQCLAPMARMTQQPCTACSRASWSAQRTPSRVAAHTTPPAETLLQHRWQTQRTLARCGDADVLHNLCEPG